MALELDYQRLFPSMSKVLITFGLFGGNFIEYNFYHCLLALPKFENKFKNQTVRRGDSVVLQCEAKGEKPMGILWTMNNRQLDSKNDPR